MYNYGNNLGYIMFGDWSSNQNGDLMIIHGDVMDIYLDSVMLVGIRIRSKGSICFLCWGHRIEVKRQPILVITNPSIHRLIDV